MKSQKFSRVMFAAATILGLGSLGNATFAAQDSNTFQVTATVQSGCTITANDLAFGAYDPTGADVDTTSTLNITCTNGTIFEVGLDGGGTGAVNARAMTGPGGTLNYSLYSNASRTTIWEDIGGASFNGTGDGTTQNLTVYGRLPSGQFLTSGSYSDLVTATVDF